MARIFYIIVVTTDTVGLFLINICCNMFGVPKFSIDTAII